MKNPMEHLKQWHNLYSGILTPNETAVYFQLFMIGNQRFWPEWIEITDWNLSLSTNINARTIPDVVNSLAQKGLIKSRRGKGKAKSGYKLNPFGKDNRTLPNYEENDVINPKYVRDKSEINPRYVRNKSEISPRLEENSSCESKDEEAPKTRTMTKTTQGQGQNISKPASKKFIPPTLEEVNEYILEKNLHVSAKDFLDYFTESNWVDSKGNKVHSWKGKILTWEKYRKPDQPQQKKTRLQENMEAADRAIAFFESQEANRNDEGNGDSETSQTVYDGVPF